MSTVRAFALAAPLLLGIAFVPFLDGEFVWDDAHLIAANPAMRHADGFVALVTRDLWGQATGQPTQLYHPLPMLTLWLQTWLGGVHVWPLRLANLLIHALAAALLARWLVRRGLPGAIAAGAGLVVLVHPSTTEPVMWLTGRHDSLAVVLVLGGLLAWPEPATPTRVHAARALGAGLLFGAAFLCKEPYLVAIALPLVWTAIESARERRRPGAARVAELALAGLPVAAALGLRLGLGISIGATQAGAAPAEHLRHFAGVLGHYTLQLVSFGNGPTIAPYEPIGAGAAIAIWIALLAASTALGTLAWRRGGPLWLACFGWAWVLVAIAPHALAVPSIGLYGNRYAYFPLFGLAICAAALIASLPRLPLPHAGRIASIALLAACALLALRTGAQARHFHSNQTLYAADLERDPKNGYALYHYATAVLDQGGCAKALPLFALATELAPRYERAWHNAAGCAIELGRVDLAVRFGRRAVALAPRNAGAHYNLGAGLIASGQAEAGSAELRAALRLQPGHDRARQLLQRVQESPRAQTSVAP